MSEDYFIDTATMSLEYYQNMKKEIERLHSIIKEARDYIEKNKRNLFLDVSEDFLDHDELVDRRIGKELLEILDKAGKENDIEFDVLKALNTDLDDDVEMG